MVDPAAISSPRRRIISGGWNVTKSRLMVLVQHVLNIVDSPTFDDSDPIHIIEYARWCK